MARYVYVLVSSEVDRYAAMCYLSAASVRYADSSARFTLLTNTETDRWLAKGNHKLSQVIDQVQVVPIEAGNVVASRVLKTTMLQRVQEDFIFLDTDTVMLKPISHRLNETAALAMAEDRFPRHPKPEFPDWVIPLYKQLGWECPTRQYFNSGVMVVRNNADSQRLFENWHERWKTYHKQTGKTHDQPALNSVIHSLNIPVETLPLKFNAMVRVDELYRWQAHVLHFFAEKYALDAGTEYENLVARVQAGEFVSGMDIDQAMRKRVPLVEPDSAMRCLKAGNPLLAMQGWVSRKLQRSRGAQA